LRTSADTHGSSRASLGRWRGPRAARPAESPVHGGETEWVAQTVHHGRCGPLETRIATPTQPVRSENCASASGNVTRPKLTAPKNGRVRYVPLTEQLFEALREYRHPSRTSGALQGRRPAAESSRHGHVFEERSAWQAWRPACISCVTRSARIWQCRRARQGESGAGGTPGAVSDAGVHAPEFRHAWVVDPALGVASKRDIVETASAQNGS